MLFCLEITPETQVVGLLGHPLGHSLSPKMHNAAFAYCSLNWCYLPFDVLPEDLPTAVRGLRALGIRGANVTTPHKEQVLPLLDGVTGTALRVGAINTIVNEGGKLVGDNTDVLGFIEPLRRYGEQLAGKNVVVFGAGGAARAVVFALLTHFDVQELLIVNRDAQKAERLAQEFKSLARRLSAMAFDDARWLSACRRASLVVNATTVGMAPKVTEGLISSAEVFQEGQIVYDIVYNPLKTKLLQLAESRGALTVPGLEMFIHQGAEAFRLWTGMTMPVEKIREELQFELEPKQEILLASTAGR